MKRLLILSLVIVCILFLNNVVSAQDRGGGDSLIVATTFSEDFNAPVDLSFWTPNTATHEDGTPLFAVTQEENALKVVMKQQNFPDGQMYDFAKMNHILDLTANPYFRVKIKVEPGALYNGKDVDNVVFMGSPFEILQGSQGDSLVRQHSNPTFNVPDDGEWHELLFDWSTPDDPTKFPNDFTNITRILLETVKWPSTHEATFWIDDFQLGEAAAPPPPFVPPIFRAAHPLAIDGELDAIWLNAPWFRDYTVVPKTDAHAENNPTFKDCALSWRGLYDDNYLYLFIEIVDDILVRDGSGNWQDDQIELWIDGDNSKGTAYDGINDLGFGFAFNGDVTNPIPIDRVKVGGRGKSVDVSGILQGSVVLMSGTAPRGLALELAIPWNLMEGVMPAPGHLMGLEVDYNDDDDGGTTRETKMKYFSDQDEGWQNPSYLGTVELKERVVYDYTDVWYTEIAPVIDGQMDMFLEDYPSFPLNRYMDTIDSLHSYYDLNLEYKMVWDNSHVYYFIHVIDDKFVQDGLYNYTDDGVEIWFDGDNSKKTTYDGINDIGILFPYEEGAPVDSVYMHASLIGTGIFDIATVPWAASMTEKGLYLEFAIPMDSVDMMPANGWLFGHEIDYNDDDTGDGRDTKCKTFSPTDDSWQNPSVLGTGMLMGGPGEPVPEKTMPLLIDKTTTPPPIDGIMDSTWYNARKIEMHKFIDQEPDDWWDLYSSYRIVWDSKNLYMFVEVHDDTIITDNATAHQNDGIEIYFDGDNSKNDEATGYDDNDDQLRFVFEQPPTSAKGTIDLTRFEYAYLKTDYGWNLEVRMPFSRGLTFRGTPGTEIGFEVQINDNDTGTRNSMWRWWSDSNDSWKNPSLFGTAKINTREVSDVLDIHYTPYPIVVDAEADYAWKDVPDITLNHRWNETKEMHTWNDANVFWRSLWNMDYLYLWIHVMDDTLMRDGTGNWQDDGIELWLDGDASHLDAYDGVNDFFFDLSINSETVLDTIQLGKGPAIDMSGFMQAQKLTEDGLVVELALPLEVLGIQPGFGTGIGIDLDYNDDDDGGTTRETKLKTYDPTDQSWTYPSVFGYARFVGSKLPSLVEKLTQTIIKKYELMQNYPNPFNPNTTIEFHLPEADHVKLIVFDLLGREVARLADARYEAGKHSIQFNASQFSSGIYFYRLETGKKVMFKKMLLVK